MKYGVGEAEKGVSIFYLNSSYRSLIIIVAHDL